MTDQEILALVMEEGRAHLATIRNAERYESDPAAAFANGGHLLREWNTARDRLRAAVLDRLEAEAA